MTTATKTTVTTTWNTAKIQEEAVASMVRQMMTVHTVLGKLGAEAQKQFQEASVSTCANYYRSQGIKTPLDLVKAMSEFEANVFGSKIRICGDDKQASMEYEYCACFNAMQKHCQMTPAEQEKMGGMWSQKMNAIAKEFGFTAELKFPKSPNETAVITFTK